MKTYIIKVYGIVQGVGFRPTVDRHAHESGIRGTVSNKGPYVEIQAQGSPEQVRRFLDLLEKQPPKRAAILKTEVHETELPEMFEDFRIVESRKMSGEIYISPDIAVCEECKEEMLDPSNRRYLHPFINCTCCGPRMTILESLPYDRERTSMKMFPMCRACREEYYDPASRRYDAQPVCCNDCGPEVYILESDEKGQRAHCVNITRLSSNVQEISGQNGCGQENFDQNSNIQGVFCQDCIDQDGFVQGQEGFGREDRSPSAPTQRIRPDGEPSSDSRSPGVRNQRGREAILLARKTIADGGIIAVKGIGGFHLCCDAGNEETVARLRKRKSRPAKPFAVMMRDMKTVKRECVVLPGQEEILTGHQKPILLLDKKPGGRLAPSVAPDNPRVGVMLPYAPIQILLFQYDDGLTMPDTFVMTSGNISGAPICRDDSDALRELTGLCDLILSHDRLIRIRADDSVMDFYHGKPYMIRRSRGYAPLPFMISADLKSKIAAVGGELKNTFCIGNGNLFYPSPYIGDLEDVRSVQALEETMDRFQSLLEVHPDALVCDLHPKYNSTEAAEKLAARLHVPLLKVQHHYAHIVSCMAENDYAGKVIGVSFDGTGYGTDGTIWGGEILMADLHGFTRAASIHPFGQIGGDASSREGWRIAVSMIRSLAGDPGMTAEYVRRLGLCDEKTLKIQLMMAERKINYIPSTSAGRLFDAVSAVLGIRRFSTFEGEASTALQFEAEKADRERKKSGRDLNRNTGQNTGWNTCRHLSRSADRNMYFEQIGIEPFSKHPDGRLIMNTDQIFRWIVEERLKGADVSELAWAFHALMADQIVETCTELRRRTGVETAALSGGVFQNRLLLEMCDEELQKRGFHVLIHSLIPPNDGGLALGQAVAGAVMLAE